MSALAAEHDDVIDGAHTALNKMARAERRGTGCHLTAAEIQSLALSRIGELWCQDDPRKAKGTPPPPPAAEPTAPLDPLALWWQGRTSEHQT